MDKLEYLLECCKCGVFLTVNEHRDYYITAAQALNEANEEECPPKIAPEVAAKMIEMDTIIRLQFYPVSPIGSYEIWHYDLNTALDEAIACLTPSAYLKPVAANDQAAESPASGKKRG